MKLLPGSNNLLATWTAPGGDYDEGSVASYRFVYSEDICDLLKPDRRPKILLAFDRMELAGTDSSYDFEFPHYDADFYVAAYGFDTAGNKGKISRVLAAKCSLVWGWGHDSLPAMRSKAASITAAPFNIVAMRMS